MARITRIESVLSAPSAASLAARIKPRQLRFIAFVDKIRKPVEDILVHERMRLAWLTIFQRVQLVGSLIVAVAARDHHICAGLRRDFLKALRRCFPCAYRVGSSGKVTHAFFFRTRLAAAELGADVSLVSVFQWIDY